MHHAPSDRLHTFDLLAQVGLDVLALLDAWRQVRREHVPGSAEYERACGAIAALDMVADRAALSLTSRPDPVDLVPVPPPAAGPLVVIRGGRR